MQENKKASDNSYSKGHGIAPVVPKGILIHLKLSEIRPSVNNPRKLFDPEPLKDLRDSIRNHGVLVPITVYKLPGQNQYAIVDGERRYRCCSDLTEEGLTVDIPANIVEAPEKFAALIYMFNIHNFRQDWELMPTALSLQKVIEELGITKNKELHELTGLSLPQIERCKKILSFPKKFQKLSLDPDPQKRVPSNFWIELYPLLEAAPQIIPELYQELGRDGITEKLVEKYEAGKLKSVIHIRRILEAIDTIDADEPLSEEDKIDNKDLDNTSQEKVIEKKREKVSDRLNQYVVNIDLETRETFDDLIVDTRKIRKVVESCDSFIQSIERAKITYTVDNKEEIINKLTEVIEFSQKLRDKLLGEDAPENEIE